MQIYFACDRQSNAMQGCSMSVEQPRLFWYVILFLRTDLLLSKV